MIQISREDNELLTATIFHTLRILNGVTPVDSYINNYKWHHNRNGKRFFDLYHFAFYWGTYYKPKKIMEIGSRTGLSLAQLLSSYLDFSGMRVVLFDMWDDGLSTPELVKKHLKHLAIPTDFIEFYQGDSRKTVPKFKESNTDTFDWILVDGGHVDEVAGKDLENVVELINPKGVIVFDDIYPVMSPDADFFHVELRPTWERFKIKYFNEFSWYENSNGKGVAWAIKK